MEDGGLRIAHAILDLLFSILGDPLADDAAVTTITTES
jgi:hypothetical protein